MGGYQYGRGDSADDDPRSQGQGGGGRRGYGSGGSGQPPGRGYGSGAAGDEPAARGYGSGSAGDGGAGGYGQQPASPPPGYDPYGSPAPGGAGPSPGGSGGRRGYGSTRSGSRGRPESITGEVVPPGYAAPGRGGRAAGSGYGPDGSGLPGDPAQTRVQDGVEAAGVGASVPTPRRSRLEERRAARNGDAGPRDASQEKSDQYPESALNGRSTRNGAAARARAGARGKDRTRPTGPVKKTGYHRYFDYPRTGKYGWKHWMPSIKQIAGGFLACFFMLLGLVAYEYETVQIPDVHSTAFAQSSSYTFEDGSTSFASDGSTDREIVDFSQIPAMVQDAVVSQEDKTFWSNPGVSYTGTLRALAVDLMGGSTQGGSTITQQFVKQAYLTSSQTTSRKIDEIFISLKLAKTIDKKTILADYLNTSPFGRNTSGIAAGAKKWFGLTLDQMNKEPVPLQASQSAFLSMMLNAPSTYSAGWDPTVSAATQASAQKLALARWQDTLNNMEAYHYINATQLQQALADKPTPVALTTTSGETIQDVQMKDAAMSWLTSYEAAHPDSGMPTVAQIQQGGYTVQTTFNQAAMNAAAKAVQTELLDKENAVDKKTLDPGLAAVDPSNGDLVAFYGGTTYENNATTRTTQAGSTFKAFTLATAFSQGWSTSSYINGDSPWPDTKNPTEVADAQGSKNIKNDSPGGGLMTLTKATDQSVNTAFIRIEEEVQGQFGAVRQTAEKFGLTDANMNTNDQWDSSSGCNNVRFTLGICFTDPARMADAYSVLAANGTLHPLTEILKITNNTSHQIFTPTETQSTAIDSNVAAEVTQMFTGVIHNSDGTANAGYTSSGLSMNNIAGKTGTGTMDITPTTTQAMSAAGYNANACGGACGTGGVWFDGYSSKIAISVGISRWQDITVSGKTEAVQIPVDNIDGSGAAYGAQFPFSIWANFMKSMQSTSYGGDTAFSTPTPNSSASVMNSPTPSAVATTPSPTHTQPTVTQTTPTGTTTSPTTGNTSASPTTTCNTFIISSCTSTSASSSATATNTNKNGNGNGG